MVDFIFKDTTTTEIYTLSLHDALPISLAWRRALVRRRTSYLEIRFETLMHWSGLLAREYTQTVDRKSTRLNSSHSSISYAVFCLKKKTYQPSCGRLASSTGSIGSSIRF